jgi:hypothetical protein
MSFSSLFVALFSLLILVRDVSSQAVFAHIVAGNSGSYSSQDWLNDINLAKLTGFDGFIMNIAPDTYNLQPMLDLIYAAAEQVGDFRIWLSFDYTGGFNTDGTPWHADQVSSLISNYSSSPAQYMWTDGRPAVTTFEGCDNLDNWTTIKAETNCFFIQTTVVWVQLQLLVRQVWMVLLLGMMLLGLLDRRISRLRVMRATSRCSVANHT